MPFLDALFVVCFGNDMVWVLVGGFKSELNRRPLLFMYASIRHAQSAGVKQGLGVEHPPVFTFIYILRLYCKAYI